MKDEEEGRAPAGPMGAPPVPGNEGFLAWLETVPDPEERYTIATSAMAQYQDMVSRLSTLRAGAVAAAAESQPVSSVARRFGVSRQRAHQLLNEAKGRGGPPAQKGGEAAREGKGP